MFKFEGYVYISVYQLFWLVWREKVVFVELNRFVVDGWRKENYNSCSDGGDVGQISADRNKINKHEEENSRAIYSTTYVHFFFFLLFLY